jgi:hypothetical protein
MGEQHRRNSVIQVKPHSVPEPFLIQLVSKGVYSTLTLTKFSFAIYNTIINILLRCNSVRILTDISSDIRWRYSCICNAADCQLVRIGELLMDWMGRFMAAWLVVVYINRLSGKCLKDQVDLSRDPFATIENRQLVPRVVVLYWRSFNTLGGRHCRSHI